MGSTKTHNNLWSHHLFIASLLNLVQFSLGSPVFLTNPNLPHFQSGRNIRHLPCLVRRTGLEGVCMFVTDCMKANGTHLGTCIDRFYFGSCCQIWPDDPFITHEINDNSIDQNTISHFQHHQLTSTTSTSTMSPAQFHYDTLIPVPTITLPSHYVNKTIATSMSTSISSSMSSSSSSSSSISNNNNFNYNNRKNITHSNSNLNSNKNSSPVPSQIITTTVTTPKIPYQYLTEKIPTTSIKTDITIDENNNAIFTYHTDNFDDKNPTSTTENIKIQTFQSVQDEITIAPTKATPITTSVPTTTTTTSTTTTTTTTTKRPITTNTPTTSTPRTTTTATTTRKPATTTIRAPTRRPTRRPTTKPTRTTIKQSTTAVPPRRTRPTASIQTTSKPYPSQITTKKPHRTTKRPNVNTTIKKPAVRPISTKRPIIENTTVTSPPTKPSVTTNKKTTNRIRPTISTTTAATETPLIITTIKSTIRPIIHQNKNKTNTTNKINQSSTISSSSTTDKLETITKLPEISLTTTEKIKLPSKKRPTTTTTSEPDTLITISYVETTKAPRPKPKPTAEIVHVPATNLDHTLLDEQQNIPNKSDSTTTTESLLTFSNTIKIDSTTTTEKQPATVTKKPTTESVTEKKPTLSQTTITTEIPSFISTQIINENQFINPNINITSTTIQPITTSTMESPGLVTWSNFNEKYNGTLNQGEIFVSTSAKPITLTTDWVLIPSIEHDILTNTEQTVLTSSTKPPQDITQNTEITSESIDSTSTSSSTTTTTTTTTQKTPTITTTQKTKPTLSITSPTTENPTESNVINTDDNDKNDENINNNEITTSPNAIIIDNNNNNITSTSITTITPPTTITTDTLVITNYNDTVAAADGESSTVQYENTTITDVTTIEAITAPSLEGIDYKLVCGKRMFPEPRIVGGSRASFGRWPWQISLRQWRTSTYLHKCGAALLNENWAITAAHCVDNVPPADLLLRLGEFDLVEEEEPYGYLERRVQIVASHPQFDPRTFEYDLALLRFYEPVIFQPNIIPVCVPETDENFIGRTAYVTGWGRLYEDGPLPSVLQEVSVPVINNTLCEGMYRSAGYIEHIPHIFICAGWKKGGYDSCEGDSGGPMVIQRDDRRFLLAGVISWGIGCAEPNQPGVYTRISEFRDWINQILQF